MAKQHDIAELNLRF